MVISIGSWNVNGIIHCPDRITRTFKTEEPDFINYVNKHHIVGLLETKVSASEKININGYTTEQVGRKISTNGRYYGGICIAIKNNIVNGVSVLKERGESEYVWLKLDKIFFNISEDLYVCFIYVSPDKGDKGFGIEVYERVIEKVARYSDAGKCLLIGDEWTYKYFTRFYR
jgi:exonuclease III